MSCFVLHLVLNWPAFLFFDIFVLFTGFPASKINSVYTVLARGVASKALWD